VKNFDASLASLWLGLVLLILAAINGIQGERSVTPLVIIGLCNVAIGAAGRKKVSNG
jgi:hypothetical protein